jgi:hypothetical protein
LDEKNLTNPKNECSDQFNSDNLSDSLYSDSNSKPIVTLYSDVSDRVYSDNLSDSLYSVVKLSDGVYSSDRGSSLYSVVIRESCELYSE